MHQQAHPQTVTVSSLLGLMALAIAAGRSTRRDDTQDRGDESACRPRTDRAESCAAAV